MASCTLSFFFVPRLREGRGEGRVNSIGVGRPGLIVTKEDPANRGKLTSKLPRSGRARNR